MPSCEKKTITVNPMPLATPVHFVHVAHRDVSSTNGEKSMELVNTVHLKSIDYLCVYHYHKAFLVCPTVALSMASFSCGLTASDESTYRALSSALL